MFRVSSGVISRGPCRLSGQLRVSVQEAQGSGSGRREHGSGQACLPSPIALEGPREPELQPCVQSHRPLASYLPAPPCTSLHLPEESVSLLLLSPQLTWPEGGAPASEAAQPWMRKGPGIRGGDRGDRMSLLRREGAMAYEGPDLPPCRLDTDGSTLQTRELRLRKFQ